VHYIVYRQLAISENSLENLKLYNVHDIVKLDYLIIMINGQFLVEIVQIYTYHDENFYSIDERCGNIKYVKLKNIHLHIKY